MAEDRASLAPQDSETEAAMMARYGIVRVPADHFLVGGYRYTSLADAIAQARRAHAAEP